MIEKLLKNVQKPARYTGGEVGSVIKDAKHVDIRFAFCFPDVYEIGMSHLGMKILYGLLNAIPDVWCQRVFAPWPDMEEQMRLHRIPLFGLESGQAITNFDFVGFSMQYELSYTNMLNMLQLANIPLYSKDRKDLKQIVFVGGPCTYNPEPIADFVDLVCIGEGEEVTCEVLDLYRNCKKENRSKNYFLKEAAKIPGIYVPSFYHVTYKENGLIDKIIPTEKGVPEKITKRIIQQLDHSYFPNEIVIPFIDIVHDRAVVEVFRGCIRGCRFCQAGYIYRPVREKSSRTVDRQSKSLCDSSGYDEISLSSLSTSDYSNLSDLLRRLLGWTDEKKISISLPSLRVDNFSDEIIETVRKIRKSGLTFAPEGGSQRLRDAINKNVTEEELMNTCKIAFQNGYTAVKLYFMLGLPTEEDADLHEIANLCQKVANVYYQTEGRTKGKGVQVTSSVACFVPKPFTPFQWVPQDSRGELIRKQQLLKQAFREKSKKINYHYHDDQTSFLEGVFARGDRRLGDVLYRAFTMGCKMDSWAEHFHLNVWLEAFSACGISPEFYANRTRAYEETLPWDHIDIGVTKEFLISEAKKAYENRPSPNCRNQCTGCGANRLIGGKCFENDSNTV